jgi:hypothetical membrane protein
MLYFNQSNSISEVGYLSENPKQTEMLKLLRFAGICGILGSVLPLVMVLSATFLSSWFSWNANALSELGVGEQSILFNSAMLIGGALNLLFAFGLYKYLGREKLIRAGVVLIMLSSISLALVGVFSVDCHVPHGIAAFGYFVLAPAGFLLIGSGTKEDTIREISFACGVAALLAILVLPVIVLALSLNVGFAVPELVEGLIISAWTIYMSHALFWHSSTVSVNLNFRQS